MCGFAGFMSRCGRGGGKRRRLAVRMADTMAHRGPDHAGVWSDDAGQVVMAHRRLSVLDLSSAGNQPMVSASGRFVIVLNGEIYNHLALRVELEAAGADRAGQVNWRGQSDTETLLAATERWGIKATLKKSLGMFAFALWDRQRQKLTLGRDRVGEKPLYYGWQGDSFLFGSELKALREHPAFEGDIDRGSMALFLRYGCIPTPYSIYRGVHKLLPGCLLDVTVKDGNRLTRPDPYWSMPEVVLAGLSTPFEGDECDAVHALDALLRDVVRGQMMADVPLGAFLSGGVDSSTVVALMQVHADRPVRTFTIGFNEKGYDEAVFARAVATHIGTEHTELYVSPEQALDVLPKLPSLYDEPFADSSQIPTFLVSELARSHVTVSLSGDGGDELFGGYRRYFHMARWWGITNCIPLKIRRLIANGLMAVNASSWNKVGCTFASAFDQQGPVSSVAGKIRGLSAMLAQEDGPSIYSNFLSHWLEPTEVVRLHEGEPATVVTHPPVRLESIVEQMMMQDALFYLPDDILVKTDRATMGEGLEMRAPMLDHRVIEFAWRLPLAMKVHRGKGKWVLRQLLKSYVPAKLIERPKRGFAMPIGSWLRGPLREWAQALVDISRLQKEGFFNPEPIHEKWVEHLSGRHDWQCALWHVLMFQAWLDKNQ